MMSWGENNMEMKKHAIIKAKNNIALRKINMVSKLG